MQNTLGMSDTIGLIQAAKTWAWVQRLERMGQNLYNLASGNTVAATRGMITRWAGSKLAQSTLMKALTKSLGYILTNAGGIVSGGIGFLLGTVASIAFKASLKILRGDLVGVYYSVKEDVTALVNVAKKIIIYPLSIVLGSCGCVILMVVMAVGAIPAMFAPYEELVAGVSGVANSEILRVDKSVQSLTFNQFLEFTVVVENVSDKTATIARVSDKMTMVGGCAANGSGQSYSVGEAGFVGELRAQDSANTVPMSYIEAQFLGRVLQPGETFEYKYSIFKPLLPANGDATYYNSIELGAAEEANKSAADNASYVVGSGGCAMCPSGYPTRSGYLTQGPATVGPGASHSGSESIDLGVPVGTEVYATHDGAITVTTGYHYGWGNTVEVASPLGFISWYTHLSAFEVSTGDTVTKGDLIGYSGGDPDTGGDGAGNTSGAHLHYEFRRNASGTYSECNGEPVTMRPPFVPEEVNAYRGAYIAAW
jgi:murein DD-endopeptidase MepM/ murein hydrolase activator NlpD